MVYTCSVDDCMPVKFPDGSRSARNRLVKGVKSMLTIFDPQAEVSPIVSTMKTKVSVKICYCQCGTRFLFYKHQRYKHRETQILLTFFDKIDVPMYSVSIF